MHSIGDLKMKANKEQDSHLKMVLSIQCPSLEVAWMEGYAYGQNDYKDSANPYHHQTNIYQYWQEGWEAGFYNEPALFPEYAIEVEPDVENVDEKVTAINASRYGKWFYAVGALVGTAALWGATIIDLAA